MCSEVSSVKLTHPILVFGVLNDQNDFYMLVYVELILIIIQHKIAEIQCYCIKAVKIPTCDLNSSQFYMKAGVSAPCETWWWNTNTLFERSQFVKYSAILYYIHDTKTRFYLMLYLSILCLCFTGDS